MNKKTNAGIIKLLKSDQKSDRQEGMLYLYKSMYDKVKHYVYKNNGNISEADDIFQDSMVALYKLARNEQLKDDINLEAYFFTICKNHWLKELKKKKRNVELTEQHENVAAIETQESILLTEERKKIMNDLIGRFGDSCYKVLRYYYYEKRRMKEIAKLLSMTNEQAAKDKKASCMKKLRTLIHKNPNFLELLK